MRNLFVGCKYIICYAGKQSTTEEWLHKEKENGEMQHSTCCLIIELIKWYILEALIWNVVCAFIMWPHEMWVDYYPDIWRCGLLSLLGYWNHRRKQQNQVCRLLCFIHLALAHEPFGKSTQMFPDRFWTKANLICPLMYISLALMRKDWLGVKLESQKTQGNSTNFDV